MPKAQQNRRGGDLGQARRHQRQSALRGAATSRRHCRDKARSRVVAGRVRESVRSDDARSIRARARGRQSDCCCPRKDRPCFQIPDRLRPSPSTARPSRLRQPDDLRTPNRHPCCLGSRSNLRPQARYREDPSAELSSTSPARKRHARLVKERVGRSRIDSPCRIRRTTCENLLSPLRRLARFP
jgi:hypothetical protein